MGPGGTSKVLGGGGGAGMGPGGTGRMLGGGSRKLVAGGEGELGGDLAGQVACWDGNKELGWDLAGRGGCWEGEGGWGVSWRGGGAGRRVGESREDVNVG